MSHAVLFGVKMIDGGVTSIIFPLLRSFLRAYILAGDGSAPVMFKLVETA
ncbi:hypothetical protein [Cytobacillus praedii]|nr:hypothetical protein [Cytobacillus praedii]